MPRVKGEARLKPEPHPLESQLNKPVMYYKEGWYCGYLDEIKKHTAIIRVIKRTKLNNTYVKIPLEDVKEINATSG